MNGESIIDGVLSSGMEQLFRLMLSQRASDLHISASGRIDLRIHGDLIAQGVLHEFGINQADVDGLYLHATHIDSIEELQLLKSIDGAFSLLGHRFRFNLFKASSGLHIAIRVIGQPGHFADLNIPAQVSDLCTLEQGLVLVNGPTGSGKSTTLAAMVAHILANQGRHVITLEDPIEFVHTNGRGLVHQREVGSDIQGFSNGLRDALRQDPDVILLGEMRDLESIRYALRAAETGHLVLSTLHANSAAKAIDRIVDVFPEHEKPIVLQMLSSSLEASVAQRLVPHNGERTVLFEVMRGTPAIRNLIKSHKTHQLNSMIETGGQDGMFTFSQYAQQRDIQLET